MMRFARQPDDRSFPELLAAYADGELDPAERARVEAWLVDHPEAHATLDAQQKLSRHNRRLWQADSSRAPSEVSWSRLFSRIHQALATPPQQSVNGPATARRPYRAPVLAIVSTAAAALLAVTLLRPTTPPGPPVGLPEEDAWAVATDDDVEIVGIQDGDTNRLVVGRPPLTGPIVLVSTNDVVFDKVVEDTDGMMPQMPPPGASVPMIVAPLAGH
jgi:anti-sigma factor RsiW